MPPPGITANDSDQAYLVVWLYLTTVRLVAQEGFSESPNTSASTLPDSLGASVSLTLLLHRLYAEKSNTLCRGIKDQELFHVKQKSELIWNSAKYQANTVMV